MTCIVGVTDGTTVVIGGDSAGTSGWALTVRKDEKVFRLGELIIGFTSSFRMGQLLRYMPTVPVMQPTDDPMRWMVVEFIPLVRSTLRDGGFLKKENEVESGGAFLVGLRGRLFEVCSDLQVGEPLSGCASVGCGFAEALGALYAMHDGDDDPEPAECALRALEAAQALNAGVRGPFVFESIGEPS